MTPPPYFFRKVPTYKGDNSKEQYLSNKNISEVYEGKSMSPMRHLLMRPETRKSMEMLFTARWNLPRAARHANLTNKEMKITFNEYGMFHPPTYETE